MKVSSTLAQDRRAWGVSTRDVMNSFGDAGSNRPEGTSANKRLLNDKMVVLALHWLIFFSCNEYLKRFVYKWTAQG